MGSTAIRSSTVGIVVGIDSDKRTNLSLYRVIIAKMQCKSTGEVNWNFESHIIPEDRVIQSITNNNMQYINIELDRNYKIKGKAGDLKRFKPVNNAHPYVIISQIVTSDKRILGYKVADYNGNIRNIRLKEILAYGIRATRANIIPVQNAIFVPAENGKREYFKSYPDCDFIKEVHIVKKNPYAENRHVPVKNNERTLNKLEEIYTEEQLVQLKEGRKAGVEIRVYANPNFTPQQMKTLRNGLEQGINVKSFAFPEYSVESMNYYIDCLDMGVNIKNFLSPKYSIAQLSELSLAVESGVDISSFCNPKISANDMAEIRERLELGIWKANEVKRSNSWA